MFELILEQAAIFTGINNSNIDCNLFEIYTNTLDPFLRHSAYSVCGL